VWPKWPSAFFKEFLIFFTIGFRVNHFPGGRRLRNSVTEDKPEMQADEGKHDGGNDEDVDRKKAAQGGASNRGASQNKARQPIADQGNATGLFGRYYYRP